MNLNFDITPCVIILLGLFFLPSAKFMEKGEGSASKIEYVMKPPQMNEEEILESFTLLDTDKDGWITAREFIRHMDLNDDLNVELQRYFIEMGTDNRLSFKDFKLFMTNNIDNIYKSQAIQEAYELTIDHFNLVFGSKLNRTQLLFVLGNTNENKILEYFRENEDAARNQDNINPDLFGDIIRKVCNKNGKKVLDFLGAINDAIRFVRDRGLYKL